LKSVFTLSPGEVENAVGENLSLIFDNMDHTHVALQHLPTVMSGGELALAGTPEHPMVHLHSLNLSWKNPT
jgi:D-arabinose 1-dehydrogenase-like Zn-dependent alcohol dehydrogenase